MTLKRFIAGAVCPQCQLQDKIVVYQEADTAYCECVRCGYRQQQPTAATPPAADIELPKSVKAPATREHVIRLHKKNSST